MSSRPSWSHLRRRPSSGDVGAQITDRNQGQPRPGGLKSYRDVLRLAAAELRTYPSSPSPSWHAATARWPVRADEQRLQPGAFGPGCDRRGRLQLWGRPQQLKTFPNNLAAHEPLQPKGSGVGLVGQQGGLRTSRPVSAHGTKMAAERQPATSGAAI
jgi:hypothetical protein